MNIAIIGANGFIGRNVISKLAKVKDYKLFLFGRSKTSPFQKKYFYSKINLFNRKKILEDFKNIDIIFYLASDSIPLSTWDNPKYEIKNNLIPFITFLESIIQLNVKKIVFISSAGTIYGSSNEKFNENSNKNPFSPYGINKLTMEYYLNYFDVKYNLKYDIFRVSNIYGEGQDTTRGLGIINTFLEKIISDEEIIVYGNGEIIRNYIYIKDVAKALVLSCKLNLESSSIYNLASDDTLTINEIIDKIKKVTNKNFSIKYIETRISDNPKIILDNSKIKNDFNQLSFTPIINGILNTYKYLKQGNGYNYDEI